MKKIDPFSAIDNVLQYIFDSEEEDFLDNPSENHVYFDALVLWSGKDKALEILKESKERLKK